MSGVYRVLLGAIAIAMLVAPGSGVWGTVGGSTSPLQTPRAVQATYATTTNWAGLIYCPDQVSSQFCEGGNTTVQGTFGCWNIPNIARTVSPGQTGSEQAITIWVGVSGTQGNDLAQIGTFQTPGSAPTAWWETLPSSAQPIPISLAAGDLVCAEADLAGHDSGGHQEWYFSIHDLTNGQEWDDSLSLELCGVALLWPACNPVDLSSSEWVVETPQIADSLSSLPAFSEVLFSSLEVFEKGAWIGVSHIATGTNVKALNLQSSVEPTSPAYMTWVAPRVLGVPNGTVAVEYLAYLSSVAAMEQTSGAWLSASLLAADIITMHASPPPFLLAWTEGSSGAGCSGTCPLGVSSPIVGINISSSSYLLGPLPTTNNGNSSAGSEACLWWAAPGSRAGNLAPGSLLLECEGSSVAPSERPQMHPVTPGPSTETLEMVILILAIPTALILIDRRLKRSRGTRLTARATRLNRSPTGAAARWPTPSARRDP